MSCSSCSRPIYNPRSSLCNGCAAAKTLEEEIRGNWSEESLRLIATDIAVSAVRQIRALRLHRRGGGAPTATEVSRARPALPRRRSPRGPGGKGKGKKGTFGRRQVRGDRRGSAPGDQNRGRSRSRSRGFQGRRAASPERRREEVQDRREYPGGDQEGGSSYYYTTESEEENQTSLPAETEGGRATSSRAKHPEEDQRKRPEEEANAPVIERSKGPEVGTEADKALQKAAYLKGLEARSKKGVRLEENPKQQERRQSDQLSPGLLKIEAEGPDTRGDGPRKRRKKQWDQK